ncbi:hypothetical protein HMPREF0262_03347 [Clostridium sp. ATCC 29733]|nr:hypothetical protein HMPREF0262_03347 [Clostridium sp. ATCC 29733]
MQLRKGSGPPAEDEARNFDFSALPLREEGFFLARMTETRCGGE